MDYSKFNKEIDFYINGNSISNTKVASSINELKKLNLQFNQLERFRIYIGKYRKDKENVIKKVIISECIPSESIIDNGSIGDCAFKELTKYKPKPWNIEKTGNNTNYTSEYKPLVQQLSEHLKEKVNENILIIADLHLPFTNKKYLDFCIEQKNKFNCTKIIFIGDIIDLHASSFHAHNVDGYSAGDEMKLTKELIKPWYKAFPNAVITEGNHCRNVFRRAFAEGISKEWIKPLNEVLEVPNWEFVSEYEYQDILFTHGTGLAGNTGAYDKALYKSKSVVIGHFHTEAQVRYVNQNVFSMIVGCGIDNEAYAFEYNKGFKKEPIVSCGVIYNNVPIVITMK